MGVRENKSVKYSSVVLFLGQYGCHSESSKVSINRTTKYIYARPFEICFVNSLKGTNLNRSVHMLKAHKIAIKQACNISYLYLPPKKQQTGICLCCNKMGQKTTAYGQVNFNI